MLTVRLPYDLRWKLLFPVAGFTSAAVLFALGFVISRLSPELLLRKLIDNLDVGAIFGLSVGLCLISRVLTHPILRLFLFILASTAAYLVSIFAALRALPFFHSSKQSMEFPLPIFLVAGFV